MHRSPFIPAPAIDVQNLTRVFDVPVREAGMRAAMRSIVKRTTREVVAVSDVTFSVDEGDVVAFLGPNGAGKTTTLKMLTGLLHPSSGHVRVLGHEPRRRDPRMLRELALVMGQRTMLIWDLPPLDSFEVARAIYEVDRPTFEARQVLLCGMLEIEECVRRPARNLSLGERMKCELALALIHGPSVVFLDEPTIGLDTTMQRRVRAFLQSWARDNGTTMLLTSHDMADVEALCERAVVIAAGKLAFDGSLRHLSTLVGAGTVIRVRMPSDAAVADYVARVRLLAPAATVSVDGRYVEVGAEAHVSEIAASALGFGAEDLQVTPLPLEHQIDSLYARLRTNADAPTQTKTTTEPREEVHA